MIQTDRCEDDWGVLQLAFAFEQVHRFLETKTEKVDIRRSPLSHVLKWETKSEKSASAQFWLFCSAA